MSSTPPTPNSNERTQDRPTLQLDLQAYMNQLDDWDMSDGQKEELIITLWNLLISCAEICLQIHPIQLIQDSDHGPPDLSTAANHKNQECPSERTSPMVDLKSCYHTTIKTDLNTEYNHKAKEGAS